MANFGGTYQNAFSMFLAHKTDSPQSDSQDVPSSENSQDNTNLTSNNPPSDSEASNLVSRDSVSNFSQLHTVASSDSIHQPYHPELPPPSEDANLEPVFLKPAEKFSEESQNVVDDDKPHFHDMLPPPQQTESLPGLPDRVKDITEDSSTETGVPEESMETEAVGEPEKMPEPEPEREKSPAEKVFEYQWPQETGGDIFMIQEQLSEFLNILSFKRKYPDLNRRSAEYHERIFLIDNLVVTDQQCDLGLTILRSEEVYEFMAKDYPDKYKEYLDVLRERERKRVSQAAKNYAGMQPMEKNKRDFILKKAVRSAAEFNAQFMRERRDERRAYMDLQTLEVHFPKNKRKIMPREATKVGSYPVALIPGQFQQYYKSYTAQELNYYPIKTALYSPHKVLKSIYADPNDGVPPEKPAEETEKDKESSSSSDDSGSGSSDSEPDSIEGETNEKSKISEEQIKKLLATPRPDTPPKKTRRKLKKKKVPTATLR